MHRERALVPFIFRVTCFGMWVVTHFLADVNFSGSGSALACGPCKSCYRPGFKSRVDLASQFKKSQTAVSTTEHHFTLSVVCLIVECTKDSVRVTKKSIQIVVGRLGWKWIGRSVLQLLLLKHKEVEILFYLFHVLFIWCCVRNNFLRIIFINYK